VIAPLVRSVIMAAAVLMAGPGIAALLPADPVAGERVLVAADLCRGSSPTWIVGSPSVSVEGGSLQLRATLGMSDFAVPSCVHVPALSPPLERGTYGAIFSYTLHRSDTGGEQRPARDLGTLTVAAGSGSNAPRFRGLNGNWYDPAAPGTGVNIVQGDSGALFAAWLTHGPAQGHLVPGTWFVMSEGRWISPQVFRGPLFGTVGSPVNRSWDAAKLYVRPAGFLKLTFTSQDEAELEATILHPFNADVEKRQVLRRLGF
jgi:hypothetical protein